EVDLRVAERDQLAVHPDDLRFHLHALLVDWSRSDRSASLQRVLDHLSGRRLAVVLPGVADPAHHLAQPRTHLLDTVGLALFPQLVEDRAAGLVLEDPLAGERARLDLAQDLAHLGPRRLAHDARAA